jgi:hypothetical protein
MSMCNRAAAILLCLATLMPWAQASPWVALSDAEQASARCGTAAASCCCEPATDAVTSGSCACAPSPARAPAPVPAAPTDDAPRSPSPTLAGRFSDADIAPHAASRLGRTPRRLCPHGTPPERLLHCVFRL